VHRHVFGPVVLTSILAGVKVLTLDAITGPCNGLIADIKLAISLIVALKANVELQLLGCGYIELCGILAGLIKVCICFMQLLRLDHSQLFIAHP
jgi:hypothetical protein